MPPVLPKVIVSGCDAKSSDLLSVTDGGAGGGSGGGLGGRGDGGGGEGLGSAGAGGGGGGDGATKRVASIVAPATIEYWPSVDGLLAVEWHILYTPAVGNATETVLTVLAVMGAQVMVTSSMAMSPA